MNWVQKFAEAYEIDISGAVLTFDPAGLLGAPRESEIRRGLRDFSWVENEDLDAVESGDWTVKVELEFRQLPSSGRARSGTERDTWDLLVKADYIVEGRVLASLETGFPRNSDFLSEFTAHSVH